MWAHGLSGKGVLQAIRTKAPLSENFLLAGTVCFIVLLVMVVWRTMLVEAKRPQSQALIAPCLEK